MGGTEHVATADCHTIIHYREFAESVDIVPITDKRKRDLEGELTSYELSQRCEPLMDADSGWPHRHVLTWPLDCPCYKEQDKGPTDLDLPPARALIRAARAGVCHHL